MDDLTVAGLDPEQYVMVRRFEDPVEAHMAKGMLESAGLECFLHGENANQLLNAAFRARLMVHRKDEEVARELLPAEDESSIENEGEEP
ncbi:MAG TPA: DUF2007 domain-containing protein [Edaphobacter sp.]|jgi:hypothetical protein|nr:DUF2007 domain-containing protein [Edaphobacter sp.]